MIDFRDFLGTVTLRVMSIYHLWYVVANYSKPTSRMIDLLVASSKIPPKLELRLYKK